MTLSIGDQILKKAQGKTMANTVTILVGIASLAALAQIAIPLPHTPVPITGQTLGVALISLILGRARGTAVVLGYLTLGLLGAPFFAFGGSTMTGGPTSGYLAGMALASIIMGTLADRGWTRSFARTWIAASLGSLTTFACGLLVLSFYLPPTALLGAGLLPFLPGDFIKTLIVTTMVRGCAKAWDVRSTERTY